LDTQSFVIGADNSASFRARFFATLLRFFAGESSSAEAVIISVEELLASSSS